MQVIKLRIMGGLGNQLYQYAAARYIQSITRCEKILIDISGYETYTIRRFELDGLLYNKDIIFLKDHNCKDLLIKEGFHIYQKIYNVVQKKHAPMHIKKIGKTTYILSSVEFDICKLKELSNTIYMYGYFVSAEIAQIMRRDLMKEIREPKSSSCKYFDLRKRIKDSRSVGISIRCGNDYQDNGWPVCSKQFYYAGMNKLMNLYPDVSFFVFADDLNKIKQEKWFENYNVTYIEDVTVNESFDLLRECHYFVCSNSSFSWWGSFLSKYDDTIIYSPNRIFSDDREDEKTRLPNMNILDYLTGEDIKCRYCN